MGSHPLPATLQGRLDRIYAAVGATRTDDLTRVTPTLRSQGPGRVIRVNFTEAYSRAQVENILFALVESIASMHDHTRCALKRAESNPDDANPIADTDANRIIRDLSDRDKHAGPRRDHSGRSPELRNPVSFLRTSGAGVILAPQLRKVGPGTAQITVDADVFDGQGNRIGGLTAICERAIADWEAGLSRLGFDLANEPGLPSDT
jgi:hypothetical protein